MMHVLTSRKKFLPLIERAGQSSRFAGPQPPAPSRRFGGRWLLDLRFDVDLQAGLAEIGPDGGGDVQPSRLRVLAPDRSRQRHGVAGGVGGGDQLLGARLPAGLLDAREEGDRQAERAGGSLNLP